MSTKLHSVTLRVLLALARAAEQSPYMSAWGPLWCSPRGVAVPKSQPPARER